MARGVAGYETPLTNDGTTLSVGKLAPRYPNAEDVT